MDPDLARGLAAEHQMLRDRAAGRRRVPPCCHVGNPGAERITLPVPCTTDITLGADLVARAIDGLPQPAGACVWVTRSGELEPQESDLAWSAAAREGFARHGLRPPRLFAITPKGWLDVHTGHRELLRGE